MFVKRGDKYVRATAMGDKKWCSVIPREAGMTAFSSCLCDNVHGTHFTDVKTEAPRISVAKTAHIYRKN